VLFRSGTELRAPAVGHFYHGGDGHRHADAPRQFELKVIDNHYRLLGELFAAGAQEFLRGKGFGHVGVTALTQGPKAIEVLTF